MDYINPADPATESSARLTLPEGDVHVWYAWTAACDSQSLRAYYVSLLSPFERERLARFTFDYLQLEYLVTRALCRCVLSRYLALEPASWRFLSTAHGKPEIDAGIGEPPPLRFNLSNASTLVACAVTRSADVGIDAERTERSTDIEELADRYFSREEMRDLAALPIDQRPRRFFQLWTLKEAYLKAIGVGLSLALDQVSFSLSETSISVTFGSKVDDHAIDWQFVTHEPRPSHMTAIAIRTGAQAPFRMRYFEMVPAPLA
jgi:4'-phosphopantetheinyl transferase